MNDKNRKTGKTEIAISVNSLCKTLGNRSILKNVDFEVKRGDIFGFLGPNGAGKTTTIRVMLGLYTDYSGSVSILGKPAGSDQARMSIGFMIDGDGLYDNMSPEANLAYYLRVYGKPVDKDQIKKVIDIVGLSGRSQDNVGTFSKGMRQKVSLAKALVHDPDVLILDEPTSGLDPSAQVEFRNIMVNVAKNENKTVLLSSHNLDEVQRICNSVALLNKGEVKLYGELETLRRQMGKDTVIVQTSTIISDAKYNKLMQEVHLGLQGRNGNSLLFVPEYGIKVPDIIRVLEKEEIEFEEFSKSEASLEEMYTSIVKEG